MAKKAKKRVKTRVETRVNSRAGAQVKSSIWTPANIVTTVRVALMPIWLLLAEWSQPSVDGFSWSAMIVFLGYVFISLTDKLDGYLARSRGEVTPFGQFLDPIADKLAVVVAFSFLLEVGLTNAWVLLVIVSREFLVSGLRMVVANAGVVVPASNLGKWKTAITMIAICGLLLVRALPAGIFLNIIWIATNVALIAAIVLTIWSGVDYFVKCWPYISGAKQ